MRRVAVVTGSRAEYGLLSPLIQRLHQHPEFDCQVLVCGMHLLQEFGNTANAMQSDSITIAAEIDILLASDTPEGISKSVGLAIIEFASQYKRLKPDLVVVLGDRFETFAAAQAAFIAHIPIAHLHMAVNLALAHKMTVLGMLLQNCHIYISPLAIPTVNALFN